MLDFLFSLFFGNKRKLSAYALDRIDSIRTAYKKNPNHLCNIKVKEHGEEIYYLLTSAREAEVVLQSIEQFEIEFIE